MTRPRVLVAVGLAAAVLAAASPGAAATRRLRPLDFQAQISSNDVIRTPIAVGAGAFGATFFAALPLKPGATITGLRMYSNGLAAARQAQVTRMQPNPLVTELVGVVSTSAASLDLFTPRLDVGGFVADPAVRVVSPAYVYGVRLTLAPGTAIWAVDVDYAP